MAERQVTYRLRVIADKSIPSTFKTFEKQALAVRDRIDKRTKQSADAAGKEAKRAADQELKERNRVTVSILRDRDKEAKAKEAADNRIIRSQRRTSGIVNREHEAMARAGQRTWEQTRTPLEQYNRKLVQLQTLLRNGKISQDTFNRAVLQARDAYTAAGTAGMGAFGTRMLTSLSTLGMALGAPVGILGTLYLIKGEFDAIIEAQRRMKMASLTAAEAQRGLFQNFQATTKAEQDALTADVLAMSRRIGQTPTAVSRVLSSTVSAGRGLTKEQVFEAAEIGLRFSPFDPEEAATFAGAVVDVMKMQEGLTPEQAAGFLQSVQAAARIVDPQKLAEHSTVAFGALVARGATLQQAGAIQAALTQRMFEKGGRRSATTGIAFGERMAEFPDVLEEQLEKARKAGKKGTEPELVAQIPELEAGQKAIQGKDFTELMGLLQTSPTLRELFLDTSWQKKGKEAVESFFLDRPGTTAREIYESLLGPGGIPRAEDAGEDFRRKLAVVEANELQKTAAFDRSVKASKERLEITDQPAARMSIIYDQFQDILTDVGAPKTKAGFQSFIARQGGLEGFTSILEERKARLERPPVFPFEEGMLKQLTFGLFPEQAPRQPTAIEQGQAKELGELIQALRAVAEATSEQTEAIREQSGLTEDQIRSAADFTAALRNQFLPSFLQQPVPPSKDVRPRSPGVPSIPRGR